MNCRRAFQSYKCRNNSITSSAIFHTSSVGLRYSLVFTCFSFFISIELVAKRNRYICVSICLMFQMIDTGSLLMPISRPGARFSKVPKLFGCFSSDIILFVSSKQRHETLQLFKVLFPLQYMKRPASQDKRVGVL